MKTAIYMRVSTEEQAKEGYSLPSQKRRLLAYCEANDWSVVGLYCDEGISGSTLKGRPQALKMLADAKSGAFENILILKVDRLCRNTRDLLEIIDTLKKYNVRLNAVEETIDYTTPTGKMMLTMLGSFAELERSTITARTNAGKEQKKLSGLKICDGVPLYGYDYKEGQMVANDKADIVKKMFELFLDGMSYRKICKYLIENNIPTPSGASIHWDSHRVSRLLSNITYKGYVKPEVRARNVEVIIDEDTFDKVQAIKEARLEGGSRVRKIAKSEFFFADVAYCSICGRKLVCKMTSQNGGRGVRHYYTCMYNQSLHLNKGDEGFHSSRMENIVFTKLFIEFFDNFEIKVDHNTSELDTSKFDKEISHFKKKLDALTKRKGRLLEKYLDQTLSDDDYKLASNLIANEMMVINSSIDELEAQKKNATEQSSSIEFLKMIENHRKVISEMWDLMTDNDKRMFVSSTIKKIKVASRQIVSIEFK